MSKAKLHILRDDGRAFCFGRKPARQGDESNACGRCENAHLRNEARIARIKRQGQAFAKRKAELEAGVLTQLASGNYALRYQLGAQVVTESLGTADERKAKVLAPLCMHQIRRTGRPLAAVPKCYADRL